MYSSYCRHLPCPSLMNGQRPGLCEWQYLSSYAMQVLQVHARFISWTCAIGRSMRLYAKDCCMLCQDGVREMKALPGMTFQAMPSHARQPARNREQASSKRAFSVRFSNGAKQKQPACVDDESPDMSDAPESRAPALLLGHHHPKRHSDPVSSSTQYPSADTQQPALNSQYWSAHTQGPEAPEGHAHDRSIICCRQWYRCNSRLQRNIGELLVRAGQIVYIPQCYPPRSELAARLLRAAFREPGKFKSS